MTTARLDAAARAIAVKSHEVATRAARATATPLGGARAPVFEGWHERADGEAISGWAYDAAHPDDTVAVEIRAGESVLATLDANAFRPDLRDAGKGDGRHGFVFPVPEALRDGSAHLVRVRIAGTDFELSGTPKEVRCWQHERRRRDYEQLNLALAPNLFAGMVEAVLTEESAPYLALATSSASLRHADQRANFESNLMYLATHPWARRFLLTTPAEAIDLLR